jgi:hemolysin activation/secretion protein
VDFQTNLHVLSVPVLFAGGRVFRWLVARFKSRRTVLALFILCLIKAAGHPLEAQVPETNAAPLPHFNVTAYVVEERALLPTNDWTSLLSKYTGTNVSLDEIVEAATAAQAGYRNHGCPNVSIAVAKEQIKDGIVTLNVFQTAIPQIVISGVCYYTPTNIAASTLPAVAPVLVPQTAATAATATKTAAPPPTPPPIVYATPEQIAAASAAMFQEMTNWDAREKDTRVHVVSTNAGPHFVVEHYDIVGNSVLTPVQMAEILTNIDGAFGTNVSIDGVRAVVEQLQKAYRDRGYVTVAVGLPQQKLTNATVKVQVTEGWLASIDVKGNRYFSSNNVMRALPSLQTNILINSPVLQAELNRANANQDRQIYPVIGPGPEPGTSQLTLNVKDQLPLHAKAEFNNQSTPGTPPLRLNSSAVYDNLWQMEHQIGVQYGFSPQEYKVGDQWNFFDKPLVADYSAYYRLPLGNPQSIENTVLSKPGSFGYNEATRQFQLPPPTGQTELTLYASRATIDTGVENLANRVLFDVPDVRILSQSTFQQGLTINDTAGFQLSQPLPQFSGIASTLAGGLDYKIYSQENSQTNVFTDTEFTENPFHELIKTTSFIAVPTPTAQQQINYLPMEFSYNANGKDFIGPFYAGLGMSFNLWFDSSTIYSATNPPGLHGVKSLQNITGSTESTGHWLIFKPSFSQSIISAHNWTTSLRADGQWASEPLISNEQFGIGGVNSVRGYYEGQAFGDCGWHVSLEEDTPPYIVGMVYDGHPLTVRASIYMDAADAYLLDPPPGVTSLTKLWGTGVGFDASVGTHWQAQFLFSVPLISNGTISRYQPFFNFALSAQF